MKRVLNGVTYNTDTSTLIARSERTDEFGGFAPQEHTICCLYQTRGGAFFLHVHAETDRKDICGEWKRVERYEFEPFTPQEAQEWIMTNGDVEILNDVLGEPPEAVEDARPSATLYIRIPNSLKERLEKFAVDEDLSINAWTMRCLERCVDVAAKAQRAKAKQRHLAWRSRDPTGRCIGELSRRTGWPLHLCSGKPASLGDMLNARCGFVGHFRFPCENFPTHSAADKQSRTASSRRIFYPARRSGSGEMPSGSTLAAAQVPSLRGAFHTVDRASGRLAQGRCRQ